MKCVEDDTRRLHIERLGIPSVSAERAGDISGEELLPLVAAVACMCPSGPAERATEEPTAEEMLAIGIAIGMREAERARAASRPVSLWRLSARLGI